MATESKDVDSENGSSASSTSNLAARVRYLRLQRKWSLKRLAEHSGVSQSMLSQVERGAANPTIGVALGIATALEVTLDELLQTGPAQPAIDVIRGNDAHFVYRSDDDCRVRTLSSLKSERDLEFYEITIQGNAELRSAPHFEGTVEHITVRTGSIRVEVDGRTVDLGRGDSAEYPADVPHAIVNRRKTVAVVYLIDTVPLGR